MNDITKMIQMSEQHIATLIHQAAALSPCKKRKVGAIITDNTRSKLLATGFNHVDNRALLSLTTPVSCEDENGDTRPTVIHAEVHAVNELKRSNPGVNVNLLNAICYVSHPPCRGCQTVMESAGVRWKVLEDFMKFDDGKQKYALLPNSVALMHTVADSIQLAIIARHAPLNIQMLLLPIIAQYEQAYSGLDITNAVAKVLEYGAKKYKPNNWRKVPDIDRYWDALIRHLIDDSEVDESGFSHSAHVLCNIAFLLELLPIKNELAVVGETSNVV